MKKVIYHALYLSLFLTLFGCKKGNQMQYGQRPMPVTVEQVKQEDVAVYLDVIGNAASNVTVQVRPQVSGMLLSVHFKEGQEVKKGDLLYTIDPAPFKAVLNKMEANLQKDKASLEYAKGKVNRYSELVKKKFVSELSFEQFETDVLISEAQLVIDQAEIEAAKINLGYCTITSPIDGKVSVFMVDPGNLVSPNDTKPLTEIRQISPIDIQFSLSQNDFQKLQDSSHGKPYLFEVLLPNRDAPITGGEVYFIDNHVDLGTGTIMLKGSISNTDRLLWPGEFVRVKMFLRTETNAITVPESAIQYGQQGAYLFLLQPDKTVNLRPVKLGQQFNGRFVVLEGLTPNDIVVTEGQINLRPGAAVIVTK